MIRFFAAHPTAANLLMVLLLALGVASLPQLKRETFPDFTASEVQVTVPYPGAGPEDVEEAVCQRLEEAVDVVGFVDETRCEALEGSGRLVVRMAEGGDFPTFLADVKAEIDAVSDLPEESERPVTEALGRQDPVVSIAVTAATPLPQLKDYAEALKRRLQRRPGVALVEVKGFSDRQVRIELELPLLRRYGLSVADVAARVARQNVKLPAGNIETRARTLLIRFDEQRVTPARLAELVIASAPSGAEVRLGDVARISERFELEEAKILFDGQPAALLAVSKNKGQDALDVLAQVQAFLAEERPRTPAGVTLTLTGDATSIIRDRLRMLIGNGWQGFALVFATMWLFFGWRFSFWVAMGLPVSFLGTLFCMSLFGLSINMLSMVALLMAIGILMDDAIVISESIAATTARGGAGGGTERGIGGGIGSVLEGAVAGVRRVGLGVFSSFLTTVAVFSGLAFIEGDIGKVLKVIPIVLIMTLAVSLIEAFTILPRHLVHSLERSGDRPPGRLRAAFGERFERFRNTTLVGAVEWAVRRRYLFSGAMVGLFFVTLGLPAGGLLKFSPFPNIDGDMLEARLLMPPGTPLAQSEAVVERLVAAARIVDRRLTPSQPGGQPLVKSVTVEFNRNRDAFEQGPHVATVTLDLLTADHRSVTLAQLTQSWREALGTVTGALAIGIKQPTFGPAGRAIELRVMHPDLALASAASRRIRAWLERIDGVEDVMDDLRLGKEEVRVTLRPGAGRYGIDAQEVASQLRAAYYGVTADEVQVGSESVELDVRLALEERTERAALERFPIRLPGGESVPLATLAELGEGRGYSRINRIEGRRTVTILGEVDGHRANSGEIVAALKRELLPQLQAEWPGLELGVEGTTKEGGKTGASMVRAFVFGLFGIYLILSFQFRSYVEPVVVMAAIPLALIGVFWGHFLLGYDLTMPSMMGFVSLAGIVVNNSILLVQFIKEYAAAGHTLHEAAVAAARERFRAIVITSATTTAGLLPLLFETSMQAQIIIPLVISIIFGVAVSTLLVILVLPALYAILEEFGWTEGGTGGTP